MSTVHVTVTQADIDGGCPADQELCPVARACSRALASRVEIDVVANWRGATLFWERNEREHDQLPLPAAVAEWIYQYDLYGARRVGPIEFNLEVPAEVAA